MTIGVQVYNTMMRAWGDTSPLEAEETFKRLQFSDVQPNEETFVTLIEVWAGSNRSDAPSSCSENLSKMASYGFIAPLQLYERVFWLWVESGSARTTENLNDLRQDMEGAGVAMSQACYDAYATAITRNEDRMKAPVLLDALVREVEMSGLDPTVTNINLALAWSKQRQSGAAARGEEVLLRIEKRRSQSQSQGQEQQREAIGTIYEGIIGAWAWEREPYRSELLCRRYMEEYLSGGSDQEQRGQEQTKAMWNSVMAAYSQEGMGAGGGGGSRGGGGGSPWRRRGGTLGT